MSKTTNTTSTRSAGKVFSDVALNFILGNAGTMSAKSIANRLGRATKSVRRKAEKLGLSLALS
jgi:hypothetical protein